MVKLGGVPKVIDSGVADVLVPQVLLPVTLKLPAVAEGPKVSVTVVPVPEMVTSSPE